MEEYAIYRDYQKVMQYQEEQRVNGRYKIDEEEAAYWKWLYGEELKEQEKESDQPF